MKLTLKVEININDDKLNDWLEEYVNEQLWSDNIGREEALEKVKNETPFQNAIMKDLSDDVLTIACKYKPITRATVEVEE